MAYMYTLIANFQNIFILGTLVFKEIANIVGSLHHEFHIYTFNQP